MMQRRVRAQGNLVEYAPIFVIMIALAKLQGGNTIIVSILAAAFLAGRLAHRYAFAFTKKNMKLRKLGMIATLCGIAATQFSTWSCWPPEDSTTCSNPVVG